MNTTLSIIDASPRDWRGPSRHSRFDDFQRHVGDLESTPDFWGAHAACHALMNGMGRVVFSGRSGGDDVSALEGLRRHAPIDVVVAPGVVEVARVRRLIEAFEAQRAAAPGWSEVVLWLDAPASVGIEGAEAHARAIGASGESVRVIAPYVSTLSPGCRRQVRVPGSCLVAPLFVGAAVSLRGVHELPGLRRDPGRTRGLERAGCGWFEVRGRRRLVHLAHPPPTSVARGEGEDAASSSLEKRVRVALSERLEGTIAGGSPSGPRLWKTLERQAHSVMREFQRQGEIVSYHVRCDEETNEGSPDPVVEVLVRVPKRVRELVIRMNAS